MKRKLSALLAIVLAVVMVFPTAVFVGAEDPADLKGITVKINGYSETTTKDVTKTVDTVKIAVGGKIVISAEAKNGYTISEAKADNPSGTVEYSESTNSFTVVGMREGTKDASVEFAVKGADSGNLIETCKITIKCENAKVDGDVQVAFVDGDNNFDPNEEIDLATKEIAVTGKLTNGKNISATVTGIKTERDEKFTDKIHVIGGDTFISVQYKITNEEYEMTEQVISLPITVNGQKIESITADLIKDQPLPSNEKFTNVTLAELIVVKANYSKESTIIGAYELVIKRNDVPVETPIDYKTFETYKDEYIIEITYNGYVEKLKFKDILKDKTLFNISIPYSFDLDVSNLTIKEYIEGQTITDFAGAKLTVKDKNGEPIENYSCEDNDIKNLNLKLTGFRYGDKEVIATLVIAGKELKETVNVADFQISKLKVTGIDVSDNSKMKKAYKAGETLDLSGLKLIVTYNNDEKKNVEFDKYKNAFDDSNVSSTPAHGVELTTTHKIVTIKYSVGDGYFVTKDIEIAVTPNTALVSAELAYGSDGKTEYFVGETFEPDGFIVKLNWANETKEYKLSEVLLSNKRSFDKTGTYKLSLKVGNSASDSVTLEIPGITVTERPVLQSIVATSSKDTYMVGDSPEVQEITITAKYDDNSTRVFKIADETTDANKVKNTYSITTGGVTYTMKLTPTRIDEDTTDIRVTYTEKITGGTTTTKYYDIEIEVVVPEAIMSYYYDSGWKTKAYMDFDDALDAAEEYADQLTSSYQQSRKPSIQLCKDITVLYDYSVKEYMEIDLNGFDLIMVPGEIFVKSTSTAELTFVNTGDEDSQIIYSKTNEDDNIIIAENDTYTIDANSGDGKYEVTITKPTNGKVTGPDEVTHGHDAKFTITPNEDYEVKTITVKEGKNTKKYDNKDNVVTVKDVQGALTITVTFQEKAWENPFSDVYKSATYYKSIQFVYENGLFSGMSATKFEPDTTMTRAMFVTVLGRLAGIDADEAASRYGTTSSFSDVSATDASISYAVPYIKWATDNGLIEGYGNGKFGPKDNITHIQMYVLMQRYAAFIERLNTSATGTNIPANDVKDIPTWAGAYEAVEYAAKKQFLVTSSNRLTPNGNAKRAELAMLLEKFCTNVLEWDK